MSVLPILLQIGRFYAALLFAMTLFGKARAFPTFQKIVDSWLPALGRIRMVTPTAILFLGIELLILLGLLLGDVWFRPSMAGAAILLLCLAGTMVTLLMRGKSVSCNCFGGVDHALNAIDVARNLVMASLIGGALLLPASLPSLSLTENILLAGLAWILALLSAHPTDMEILIKAKIDPGPI